jgi:hypothetical protein
MLRQTVGQRSPPCSFHLFPLLLWRVLSSRLFCVHYTIHPRPMWRNSSLPQSLAQFSIVLVLLPALRFEPLRDWRASVAIWIVATNQCGPFYTKISFYQHSKRIAYDFGVIPVSAPKSVLMLLVDPSRSWWWRQYAPVQCRSASTRLHGAVSQKTFFSINSYLLQLFLFHIIALCRVAEHINPVTLA